MSEHKKKQAPPRLNPPQSLAARESFAFLSPYPLDDCARHVIAQNEGSLLGRLMGQPRTRATVITPDMNDQYFALTSVRTNQMRGWAVGAVRDVDGERTWVEGAVGVATSDLNGTIIGLIFVNLLMVVATGAFGFPVWVVPAFALFCYALMTVHTRKVITEMRRHVRDVFGVRGHGKLPVHNPPHQTGDEHRPTA